MNIKPHVLVTLLATLLPMLPLAAATTQAPGARQIPVSQFFKRSDTTGAALSHNGRFVAVRKISPHGRSMLTVVDAAALTARSVANFPNADVDKFFWLSDQRLAFTVINVDHDGSAGKSAMYAVDRDGQNRFLLSETIVRKPSFAESDVVERNEQSDRTVHGFGLSGSEDILVLANYDGTRKLERLNTRTRHTRPVRAPLGTYNWLIDAKGHARIATVRRGDSVLISYFDKDEWRQIDSRDEGADPAFVPLLYADDKLYVRARNGQDRSAIYHYDLATQALGTTPLITAPGFDTNGYFIVNDTRMLGFRLVTDAETTVWFDKEMKAIQQEVDQLLPGMVTNLSRGRSSETPYVLIDAYADTKNHTYVLYNTETKQQILLGESTPDMPFEQMGTMSLVRYKARDGVEAPAFLTLPRGVDSAARSQLPTVVLLGPRHGKRSATWEWDAEVQFLASRGYAVLQPEPRGVDGFGRAHLEGGREPWRSIDDIADAVAWAVAKGHTDPERVCVAGTGDGGYAAMKALLRHAANFRCGINWSGVTGEAGRLDDTLGAIRQPVLLAYGTDDEAVSYRQGQALFKALRTGNSQVQWHEYTSTVENWKTQNNRINLWQQIERFLERQFATHAPGSGTAPGN